MIDEKILNSICTEMLCNRHIYILSIFANQYGAYFTVPLYERDVSKKCNSYLSETNLDKVLIVHKESNAKNKYRLHERDSAKQSDIDSVINLYKLKGAI